MVVTEEVCIVAIAKDELPFIDEWVAYHILIGFDHMYIYDDEEGSPLSRHFEGNKFVTTIKWHVQRDQSWYCSNQILAYSHAKENFLISYEWVMFIDIDEFLVLKNRNNIKTFLMDFPDVGSISFNWLVFGHNGYYSDPTDLITTTLTRRMYLLSLNVKSIARVKLISEIRPHHCVLSSGIKVDANNNLLRKVIYPGIVKTAHTTNADLSFVG